tara:strand:- start:1389 stop:1745 length:357 start_codon:yes stop_codon:yes gene_type:complete
MDKLNSVFEYIGSNNLDLFYNFCLQDREKQFINVYTTNIGNKFNIEVRVRKFTNKYLDLLLTINDDVIYSDKKLKNQFRNGYVICFKHQCKHLKLILNNCGNPSLCDAKKITNIDATS